MQSNIQWPRAKYWTDCFNPIIGCRKCSPACVHCYAERVVSRFNMTGCDSIDHFRPTHKLKARLPRKGVVFCGNMTDLFGEWVEDMELELWHELALGDSRFSTRPTKPTPTDTTTYLFLTKRVERMANFIRRHPSITSHGRFRYGMTAENQEWYDRRICDFRSVFGGGRKGWLSAEPLLGPIDLGLRYIAPEDQPFDWVVVGSESGPMSRQCRITWVESIVEQCVAAGVSVFVKQLEIDGKLETDIEKFPEHLRLRQVPWYYRIQQKG